MFEMTVSMVDVVLPCLNERGALPWVLSRLPHGYRAIVVDNGSVDGSAEFAESMGATVVREDRRGFGAAAHAGLLAATAEFVAFCDCDGSLDPAQLPALLAPVMDGNADLVLGSRRPQPGSWPLHARIANRRPGIADPAHDRGTRDGSWTDAGRTPRRAALPGAWRTAAAATPWRCSSRPACTVGGSWSSRAVFPAHRQIESHRHPTRNDYGGPGHVGPAQGGRR